MNFWKKIGSAAAVALVFGLVAGFCFSGVTYYMGRAITKNHTEATELEDVGKEPIPENVEPAKEPAPEIKEADNKNTDTVKITEEVMPSVVAITNVSVQQYYSIWYGSQEKENTSAGSGVIVNEDDDYIYIVTNNHVISGASKITVEFIDEEAVEAVVKGTSPSIDIAVVAVAKDDMKTTTMDQIKVVTMGDSQGLAVGQDCVAIGNAMGYGQSVTKGIVSAIDREVTVRDQNGTIISNKLIQTDAAINPGNSGGALLDANGNLIGINSIKFTTTSVEGMGYAIPINTVKPLVNKFINNDVVDVEEKGYFGIAGIEVSDAVVESYGIPSGLCISKIGEGSPAEKAGLEVGDIVIKFNGREISSMNELNEEIQYLSAGTTVPVVIAKKADGYTESTLNITLGKRESQVTDVKDIENGKIEEAPKENIPQEDKKQEEKSERSGSPSYNKILEDILEWPFNFFD